MMDLIFPNREPATGRGFEPSLSHVERVQGFGPPERVAFRHRRVSRIGRLLRRDRAVVRTVAGDGIDRPVRRRRVLLGLGTGVVMAGGAYLAVEVGAGIPGAWAAVGCGWLVGLRFAKTWVEEGRWSPALG